MDELASLDVATYDRIADWYAEWEASAPPGDDVLDATAELLGDVTGMHVCDLACGQGRITRFLAHRGAKVVGVDSSPRMLEFADAEFDGVLCFMALMDIAELEPTLRAVHRVLRIGGWFVFAVLHPCYHTPRSGEVNTADGWLRTVGQYFNETRWQSDARTGPPGKVGAYHRMLSTYLNGLISAGFILERFAEPLRTGRSAELRPIWTEVPSALVVRCARV